MTLKDLVSKYIQNSERALSEIELMENQMQVDTEKVRSVVEAARRYLEDAKYYQKKGRLETSLASVAYSEGILDALRLLGAAKFSWRGKKRGEELF
jgi:FAD synthetase